MMCSPAVLARAASRPAPVRSRTAARAVASTGKSASQKPRSSPSQAVKVAKGAGAVLGGVAALGLAQALVPEPAAAVSLRDPVFGDIEVWQFIVLTAGYWLGIEFYLGGGKAVAMLVVYYAPVETGCLCILLYLSQQQRVAFGVVVSIPLLNPRVHRNPVSAFEPVKARTKFQVFPFKTRQPAALHPDKKYDEPDAKDMGSIMPKVSEAKKNSFAEANAKKEAENAE